VSDLPVGARVTYDDEPDPPQVAGVIALPTAAELAHVKTYPDPVGPEHGDVLVDWGDFRADRSWERPMDLRVIVAEEQ
jgi:hypothetical protein